MGQLREHMQKHLLDAVPPTTDQVLDFRRPQFAPEKHIEGALALVYEASETIKAIESHAREMENRAQGLAETALKELRLAESRVRAAEAARIAADAGIREANAKVREVQSCLAEAELRITTIEEKFAAAEQRATSAATQADEAQKALIRIEEAIRTQLLKHRDTHSNKLPAAA